MWICFGGPIKIEYFLVFNVGKRIILSVFQQLQLFFGGMLKFLIFFGGSPLDPIFFFFFFFFFWGGGGWGTE